MADAILLDPYVLPEKGKVDLHINWSFDIQITAEEARQKVDGWLLDEVSYMIGAGEPLLVVDGVTVVWRVPAIFTATHVGAVGVTGTVDVNVQTGIMNDSPECKKAILQKAEELSQKMPPYKPKKEMPQAYLAKDLPSTITQPQGNPLEIIAASR